MVEVAHGVKVPIGHHELSQPRHAHWKGERGPVDSAASHRRPRCEGAENMKVQIAIAGLQFNTLNESLTPRSHS
jgi:hypothetical protein